MTSHYLFECIHPFYDGNGRTGRCLLALYLDESLSIPTVLSLSRTIAENKNVYYAAFSSVENPLNHGEMTHFVYAMLELIRTAQSSMIERLQSSIEHFEAVRQNSLSKKERKGDCFCFSAIRPLRHDFVSYLEFDRRYHRTWQADNEESS